MSSENVTARTPYAITRRLEGVPFDEAVERVRAALAAEGFGVLSVIDVAGTLEQRLGAEIDPYLILGACKPDLAHRGIGLEPDLGVLLPCNVVVRQHGDHVHVAAMEPHAALAIAGNDELTPLATEAHDRLTRAVEAV